MNCDMVVAALSSLVIGYGSIGKRHAILLSQLGSEVALLTAQKIEQYPCFTNLEEALYAHDFDHIIIANPTHLHYKILKLLDDYQYSGIVLVEKPLYAEVHALSSTLTSKIVVAYNLRFHSLLTSAKQILGEEPIISFSAHVGQYLPSWRPDQDYRKSYSAQKKLGGGVLRDLSHEIDYCLWFCGPCQALAALGGQLSTLEVDSDDVYSILMRCEQCPVVNVQLNYLNQAPKREILIQTNKHMIMIDLIKGLLTVNGEVVEQVLNEMEQTYRKQLAALIANDFSSFTSYQQGLEVVRLIKAIETANHNKVWINL